MCGIFGYLARPEALAEVPGREFFDAVGELLELAWGPGGSLAAEASREGGARLLRALDRAQSEAYRWLAPGAFVEVLSDPGLEADFRGIAGRLRACLERFESEIQRSRAGSQSEVEFLNRLLVGAKDILWQVERDLLGKLSPVRALAAQALEAARSEAGLSREREVLATARELELALDSLDRLEVRGRDSAGIAAYVRFPSAQALDRFLASGGGFAEELRERSRLPAFVHGSALRPASADSALLFAFKVANEVGRMGENAAFLREAIARDRLFQGAIAEPGARIQFLAHTRWASNGVVSLPNCHPVDGAVLGPEPERAISGRGEIVAVLNGDVDNYLELRERYVGSAGLRLEDRVTTDAKIIPVVIAAHYRETRDLGEAFRRAFGEFEGSLAIGAMAADRAGEFVFGQKGSGQGLFLGFAAGAVAVASELYGLVELTPRYLKAEGDRRPEGEVWRLRAGPEGIAVEALEPRGAAPVPRERLRTAEITTRDIHRGPYPHFFLKEITESVESVRKTVCGKFEMSEAGVRFRLGPEVLGGDLLEGLRAGRIRRILCIGQGTAAVAAEGVAMLIGRALRRSARPIQVAGLKATELSGHHLRPDMSDTVVVAVSQSGTTTDTNRTVDLAAERGAWILAIANRRNSDLVYKSRGVLYTSDGRDVEMSVASTKAFYAQNAAGQILALALAAELGALEPAEISREAEELLRLPEAMARTLERSAEIRDLARSLAVKRRHWAVVGTGAGKIAADEIRIKLSELCYKSIAVDFLEDKKHIDLSSEPLVIVCASGAPPENVSDLVKEVAIFKAHRSLPIVIADEGETRFDPYAAGCIRVPAGLGALGHLPATLAGHLLGYHAAAALESAAERLRSVRAAVLRAGEEADARPFRPDPDLTGRIVELEDLLASGAVDAGLGAAAATRLYRALEVLLGRLPAEALGTGCASSAEGAVAALTEAIGELSRPIDAIKHQAKTVTVGISRGELAAPKGRLSRTIAELGAPLEKISEANRRALEALEPLLSSVDGATAYRVEGLDPLGRPTAASTIRVVRKTGCSARMESRCEGAVELSGTKWGVLNDASMYLGLGKTDERRILIVPAVGQETSGLLVLCHVSFLPRRRTPRELRLRALEALPRRLERLKIAVTERNRPWRDELVDEVDNETLFLKEPDAVAEFLLQGALRLETRT